MSDNEATELPNASLLGSDNMNGAVEYSAAEYARHDDDDDSSELIDDGNWNELAVRPTLWPAKSLGRWLRTVTARPCAVDMLTALVSVHGVESTLPNDMNGSDESNEPTVLKDAVGPSRCDTAPRSASGVSPRKPMVAEARERRDSCSANNDEVLESARKTALVAVTKAQRACCSSWYRSSGTSAVSCCISAVHSATRSWSCSAKLADAADSGSSGHASNCCAIPSTWSVVSRLPRQSCSCACASSESMFDSNCDESHSFCDTTVTVPGNSTRVYVSKRS